MDWLLAWIAAWPLAGWLRRSLYVYPFVNAAHLLGIALLVGAAVPADLRLLGCFKRFPVSELVRYLTGWAAVGLGIAALTGILLFTVKPQDYAGNPAFVAKIAFVLVGAANALTLRRTLDWRLMERGEPVSGRIRLGAAVSLACWLLALVAGRWIAFLE